MAISNVLQRDSHLYVYDENGVQTHTFYIPTGSASDGLKSFTSSSINAQYGSYMFTYDERGQKTGEYPV